LQAQPIPVRSGQKYLNRTAGVEIIQIPSVIFDEGLDS